MDVHNFYTELFESVLGLDVLGLESQYQSIVKLIETKTLVTFGNYIPALYRMYLDLTDEANIIRKDNHTLGVEYYLSDPVLEKFRLPILGVEKIDYNNVGNVDPYDPQSSAYYSSIIASRNNITLESVLMGAEYTYNRTLTDIAFPWKRYHEYRGGNVLYLQNYTFGGTAEITVKTTYPNITSIPEEYREVFITLAKHDARMYLWHHLRYLEDIVTPSGNLSLRFDWSNAEQEREDYLRELRNKSLPDRVFSRYFTIV